MLKPINRPDQTPNSNGLTSKRVTSSSLSSFMVESLEAISAGKTTETRLIKTIDIVNRKTAHMIQSWFLFITLTFDELSLFSSGSLFSFLKYLVNS